MDEEGWTMHNRGLLLFLAAGLSLVVAIRSILDSRSTAEHMGGLHSDEAMRRLAPHDIGATTRAAKDFADVPCLGVVPAGTTRPRVEVFRDLGLVEEKLGDFRTCVANKVVFLFWQVSPSYDIVCMSYDSFGSKDSMPYDEPRRKVYGVRLVSRTDGSHILW